MCVFFAFFVCNYFACHFGLVMVTIVSLETVLFWVWVCVYDALLRLFLLVVYVLMGIRFRL
ncbi:hypothetical protein Hdeb2414_s0004g00123321 [Helianthus debilis subsp. tardiflorus]